MTNEQPLRKRGRPPGPRGVGNHLPPRMLGRVDDETWDRLHEAARKAGEPFSHWALRVLETEAKRVLRKK